MANVNLSYSFNIAPLQQATQAVNQHTAAATAMGAAVQRAGQQANQALGGMTRHANSLTPPLRLATHQMGNLTSQVNDLAVGLVGGQNPFRLMIEQGFQIVQLFGPGVGVGAALRATGSAIRGFLLNPLTLTTIALGVAALAAQKFYGYLTRESQAAESVLKSHKALVDQIRDSWNQATKGVHDYNMMSMRAQGGSVVDQIRAEQDVGSSLRSSAATSGVFSPSRYSPGNFGPYQGIVGNVRLALQRGTGDFREFKNQIQELQAQLGPNDPFAKLAGSLAATLGPLAQHSARLSHLQDYYKGILGDVDALNRALGMQAAIVGARGAAGTMFGPGQTWMGQVFPNIGASAGVAGPMTGGFEDWWGGRFAPFGAGAGAVGTGVGATPWAAPGAGAAGTAGGLANPRLLDQTIAKLDELRNATRGFAGDFVSGMRAGQSAVESLTSAMQSLLNKLVDRGLDMAVNALLGPVGSPNMGAMGMLFGALNPAMSMTSGTGVPGSPATSLGAGIASSVVSSAGSIFNSVPAAVAAPSLDPLSILGTAEGWGAAGVGVQYPPSTPAGAAGQMFTMQNLWAGAFQMHKGGTVGDFAPMRRVHPGVFANAPRLHSGLGPNEFPAILERGEQVISRAQGQRSSGRMIHLGDSNIHVSGSIDQKTLSVMELRMEERDQRRERELTRTLGVRNAQFAKLRG